MTHRHYELIVVGAGPAGIAAAVAAASAGVLTLLIDEQAQPGGQIYRHAARPIANAERILGKSYLAGQRLIANVQQLVDDGRLETMSGGAVWDCQRTDQQKLSVSVLANGESKTLTADRVALCCGAQERPMPIPGWELPGVMTAGAGQITLKNAGMVPTGRVVLAGSGPLLSLLVSQYIEAGVNLVGILDTAPRRNLLRAIPFAPAAILALEYLLRGVGFWLNRLSHRIPVYRQVRSMAAIGSDVLSGVQFIQDDAVREIECEHLLLHNGVIPQLQLAQVGGCEPIWNAQQQCWQIETDRYGETEVQGIFIEGDGRLIGGARLAELEGSRLGERIAALAGKRPGSALWFLRDVLIWRNRAIRPFLDALFRPSPTSMLPADETLVCRCEEIAAGTIREIARRGCQGPNQAKSFSRAGMGPCQGRQCSLTVAALIADTQGVSMSDMQSLRARPPVKPITLGQMGGIKRKATSATTTPIRLA